MLVLGEVVFVFSVFRMLLLLDECMLLLGVVSVMMVL